MRSVRLLPILALLCGFPSARAADLPTTAQMAGQDGFRQAYRAMVTLPSWVITAKATSVPVTPFTQGGRAYFLGHMCRPHDCAAEQLEVIFAQDHSAAWGLLSIRRDHTLSQSFLGSPDASLQQVMQKAYKDNNPSD